MPKLNYQNWEQLRRAVAGLDDHRFTVLIRCAEALSKIGPRAAELLGDIADGLEVGITHGDWEDKKPNGTPRNRAQEAREEARDGVNYTTDEILKLEARLRAMRHARAAFIEAHEACVEAAE